jgi:hypothetical protein
MTSTAETTTTPPVETKDASTPAEDSVKKEAKAVEKKSFFAMMCGCLGGSGAPPAADADGKEPTKKDEPEDVEKEEVAEELVAEKAEA